MAKDKNDMCQLNLKGVDCDMLMWYRKLATEKNRSLNQQLLYILKTYKQVRSNELIIPNFPHND